MDAYSSKKFAESADPHRWLIVAGGLHNQAIVQKKQLGKGFLFESDLISGVNSKSDLANRACFLLCGFALENAIKSFLVYEHPEWISNGKLGAPLLSHKLVQLRNKSRIIPYRRRHTKILRAFESGLESWARYPCAVSIERSPQEEILSQTLWFGYKVLMTAYAKKMVSLLRAGWSGPHGTGGRYEISSEFFSMLESSSSR